MGCAEILLQSLISRAVLLVVEWIEGTIAGLCAVGSSAFLKWRFYSNGTHTQPGTASTASFIVTAHIHRLVLLLLLVL